ncbi:MAG: TolC family protein, partial [Bdellovibrionales bacterium]|nr:TolC family protein [Bdellovibrionales bacterium]NQZ20025.1 TolC family protein [Bdellovibrionales bacterium]
NVVQIRMKDLACTSAISSYGKAPMEFTYYDDIAEILGKEQELERKVARTYDDPKVKLVGEYASVGRDFGYGAAQDNFSIDPRDRRSVGLQVSIPLGSRTRDSREIKEMAAKNRYKAMAESNLLKVKAYHEETAAVIKTLQKVIQNQQETNKSLTQSLKLSRRKYKQARISLQELISEQDARLNSQLSEIDTNLIIVNTLMDYFGIFAELPCNLNRI